MTEITKLMCGAILLSVPTIEYGGFFLLSVLFGKYSEMGLNSFQKAMFRAGHAHAGVLVILALVAQILADYATLSDGLLWFSRVGFPISAILVSGGFFGAAAGKGREKPGPMIWILYAGVLLLAASLIILGIGLLR
ncbi:MAG: hypothetical protein ACP5E3_06040 [Bacteroidales bacterium]